MNYPAYISPSIACCPLECLEEHVHRLEQIGIEMLHVDITVSYTHLTLPTT